MHIFGRFDHVFFFFSNIIQKTTSRDVLASIGGVAVLFPLLFLLLVAPQAAARAQWQATQEGPTLSLLLSILARVLRAHETNQKEFHRINGVAMLEHAIRRIPPRNLRRPSPAAVPSANNNDAAAQTTNDEIQRCVGMLMDLCTSAAQGHPQLEAAMVRRLLSPAVWVHAPLELQIELQRQLVRWVG